MQCLQSTKAILHKSECWGFVLTILPCTRMRLTAMNVLVKEDWNVSSLLKKDMFVFPVGDES